MKDEKTAMQSPWESAAVEWVEGPGAKPKLTPQERMALSEEGRAKILQLINLRKSLPDGPSKRAQQLAIASRIWDIRHPGKKARSPAAKRAKAKWLRGNRGRNREKHRQTSLGWYYRNRPPLKTRILKNTPIAVACRDRRKRDMSFCLAGRLRATLNRAFRRVWVNKPAKTEELLGCTIDEAKVHLESHFTNGMSWENRHTWHIDHFVPVVAFDLQNREEALLCFNWRNLRPLYQKDNQTKQASIPSPLPSWLPAHIAARIESRRK